MRAAMGGLACEGNNIDPDRLIIAGESAGGHLALTTGMIPANAGFDRTCFTVAEPRVAAIVNFFGITDIDDLLDGPNKKPFPRAGRTPCNGSAISQIAPISLRRHHR